MKRICAYIDGFNVYHNLQSYIKKEGLTKSFGWVNLRRTMSFFVPEHDLLEKVVFFSALPTHSKDKTKQSRHQLYYDVLKDYCDVEIVDGRFGKTRVTFKCGMCGKINKRNTHEEKETDVSVGIHIMHDVLIEKVDKIILVSADTDFIPVVKYVLEKAKKEVLVLTPLGSHPSEPYKLGNINHKKYRITQIKKQHIIKSKLEDIIKVKSQIYKNPYA